MQIQLTKKDVIWSYIGTILSMGANLLMLPVVMYYLDGDMLGLWYIFTSIGVVASLFDFGFALTFARNITYCWSGARELKKENVAFVENGEPDFVLIKKVLRTCKAVYLRIAGTVLLLMLTVGSAYIIYVSQAVVGSEHIYAWLVYAVAIFLNLYYGYYASFLRGVGAISDANKNTIIARVIQISATLLFLSLGFGIIGVSVAYLLYGTTFRYLGKHKFYRYQGIGEKLKTVSIKVPKKEMKELIGTVWHNAWRDGVISLSIYLSNQASTIICSLYLSLKDTGMYSVGVQLAMGIGAVSSTLYMALQPQLQAAYINRDRALMRNTMSVIVVSLILLFCIGVIGVVIIVFPLLNMIKPEAVVSIPVLLALCVYQFILQYRNSFTSYFSCTNRIPYLRSFIVSSIGCILLSILFTGYLSMGLWGLIYAQIISQIVFNTWYWPKQVGRELEITVPQMVFVGIHIIRNHLKEKIRYLQNGK